MEMIKTTPPLPSSNYYQFNKHVYRIPVCFYDSPEKEISFMSATH